MGNELVVVLPVGRPTLYSPELADRICELIANDNSLRKIGKLPGMPDKSTILRWLANYPDFATKCARARELQADLICEEHRGVINKTIKGILESDVARVALSGLEWQAAKKDPKKYGNSTTIKGDPNAPLVPKEKLSHAELTARANELLAVVGIGVGIGIPASTENQG